MKQFRMKASVIFAVLAFAAAAFAAPTGNVKIWDGGTDTGTLLFTGPLNYNGQQVYSTTTLAPGTHSLTAEYLGDGTYPPAVSDPVVVTVNGNSSSVVTLTCTPNPVQAGAQFSCTVTVTAGP